MTNEEAITNLNIIREAVEDYVCNYLTDTAKAQKILNALQDMEQQPSDTVSRGAFEQVIWERDVAIGQLKELGYGLGQKVEPCDDAISRNAVYNIINDIRDCISIEGYCAIIKRLKKLPPVTPKSETVTEFADRCRECGKMRKGHWIWNFDKGYCKCSECGIGMGHKEFDYCPNCGAKMKESEDKE